MPRTPRLQVPDVVYHVASRGVEKRIIFDVFPGDRDVFVRLLAVVVKRFGWKLYAYCLMGNHFHLVVETPLANISAGMQFLKGEYARWFNAMNGREGALFERRFWSGIALDESYVLELSRYVILNPVRAGIVASPGEWQWSSYGATVGLERPPAFLDVDGIRSWFGGGEKACVAFAEFTGAGAGLASLPDTVYRDTSGV